MGDRCPRTNQIQVLLYHARSATLFFSEDGQACASVPTGVDSRRVLALRSPSFRDWLTGNYYSEYETAPSASAFRAVLHTLEARARFGDFPPQKVDRRLSFEGDPFTPARVFLDLANAEGEIVEISSKGWQITGNLQRPFRQSPTSLPLPRPDPQEFYGSALERFAELFRLTAANRIRALIWLIAAFRPVGPYPILVLRGPTASGKSLLARALRDLIDPSTAPIRRLPARDRELRQLTSDNWLLIFDQVHRFPFKISEALCAISSGDSVEIGRALRDAAVFRVSRPVVLIVPSDEGRPAWMPSRMLSNRTLLIDLEPIAALRPEAALWSEFETIRPAVLAELANAMVIALRRLREIDLGNVARFPDCATWATAAAPALALEQAAILEAFADPRSVWSGSDPLRDAVYALLADRSSWSGTASELLAQLGQVAPPGALPASPKGLSQALAKIAGISLIRKRDSRGERVLILAKIFDASEKTPATAGTVMPGL